MKKEELISKVAELVGVSNTESEFAFKLFLDHIAGTLNFDQAIKIPNLGIFQLKKNFQSQSSDSMVIFAPSSDEFDPDSSSMFLTFKVELKEEKASNDFNEDVFSLGVNKPTVPLKSEEEVSDVNASYHILKKSIEERIKELISNSLKMEDYDLWEDYLDQLNNPETKNEDFEPEDLMSDEDLLKQMIDEDEESEFTSPKQKEEPLSGFDALEKDLEAFRQMAEKELTDDEEPEEEPLVDDSFDGLNKEDIISELDDDREPLFDDEEDLLEPDTPSTLEGKMKTEGFLDDDDDHEDINPDEDPFAVLRGLEEDEEIDEDGVSGVFIPEEKSDENGNPDFMDEIENDSDDEDEPKPIIGKDTGIIEDNFQKKTKPTILEIPDQTDEQPEDEEEEEKVGLKFWIIAGSVGVIIIFVTAYFLFFSGSSDSTEEPQLAEKPAIEQPVTIPPANVEGVLDSQVNNASSGNSKPNDGNEIQNNLPPVEEVPITKNITPPKSATNSASKGLYRTVENDRIASGTIFTDGSVFSIQIGSSRSKSKSEAQVRRLRAVGHNAYLIEVYLPKKGGTWYRMRVGDFNTIAEAQNYKRNNKF